MKFMGVRGRVVFLFSLVFLLGFPARGFSGESVSIRLVRASHHVDGVDAGLRDVAAALGTSFAFRGYTLVAQTVRSLPAAGETMGMGSFRVRCEGTSAALTIRVDQGRRRLLETSARLSGRRPLILGGFPSGNGDLFIFVFLLQ